MKNDNKQDKSRPPKRNNQKRNSQKPLERLVRQKLASQKLTSQKMTGQQTALLLDYTAGEPSCQVIELELGADAQDSV